MTYPLSGITLNCRARPHWLMRTDLNCCQAPVEESGCVLIQKNPRFPYAPSWQYIISLNTNRTKTNFKTKFKTLSSDQKRFFFFSRIGIIRKTMRQYEKYHALAEKEPSIVDEYVFLSPGSWGELMCTSLTTHKWPQKYGILSIKSKDP